MKIEITCTRRFKGTQLGILGVLIILLYYFLDNDINYFDIISTTVLTLIITSYIILTFVREYCSVLVECPYIKILNFNSKTLSEKQFGEIIEVIEQGGKNMPIVLFSDRTCFSFDSTTKDGRELKKLLQEKVSYRISQ